MFSDKTQSLKYDKYDLSALIHPEATEVMMKYFDFYKFISFLLEGSFVVLTEFINFIHQK